MKIIIVAIAMFFLSYILFVIIFLDGALGFPSIYPHYADCIGYKTTIIKPSDVPRIHCYGVIYNLWLE